MTVHAAPGDPPTGDRRPGRSDATNAGVLVWGQIGAKATEALVPLLVVRFLGQADVGLLVTLLLTYETVALILTAGFPASTLYFYAGRTSGQRRVIAGRLVRLLAALGVAAAVALHLLGRVAATFDGIPWGLTAASAPLLTLLGLYALFDLPSRIVPNVLLGEGRARASAGFVLLRSVGGVTATLAPLLADGGVKAVIGGFALFGLVEWVVGGLVLWRLYRASPSEPERLPSTWEMVRYALPLGATDIVNQLNRRVDIWLVVLLFGLVDVAVYQAGAWQIPIITTIAYSVGSAYVARYTELHRAGANHEAMAVWRQTITKVSLIVVPTSAVFFVGAEELVELAFTGRYGGAAPVFRLYTLLTMARVTAFAPILVAAGRPGYVLRSAWFTLWSNVALSVPLVLLIGPVGAALGTVVAFVPTVIIYSRFIARAWQVPVSATLPLGAFGRVVAAVTVPAGLGWAAKAAVTAPPGAELALVAVVVLGSFSALGSAVGLIGRDDWAFLGNWLQLGGDDAR